MSFKELQHKVQFDKFETDKTAEIRPLKVVDSLWKRVWDKWVGKPQETYNSLKYGETEVEEK